jgi:beta-glucosidase
MRFADIPEDFLWGAATAAYQIEGATSEDGRGESVWDRFAATPGNVVNGDTGALACDHYHRYGEDVELMARMGLQAYRFSIAWPRIIPAGTGLINSAGLDFYDRLVDRLLAAGIRPFATLYHWDLPQVLQDRHGGWVSRETVDAFAGYVDAVSRRLGDRVHDWITLNEPACQTWLGYAWGIHAPGEKDPAHALRAAHHLLLGHGRAVPILRRNSPGARVGITLNLYPIHPYSERAEDQAVAWLADGHQNRLFLDPLFRGTYPADLLERYGNGEIPIEPGDLRAISAPIDLLGINYYNRLVLRADRTGDNPAGTPVRLEGLGRTAMDWEIYPDGLYEILMRVHREYGPVDLYVTESGAAFDDVVSADGAVHDERRVTYLQAHFAQAARAVASGAPLRGYFVWSLLDNFEWAEGYGKRFGIVYVDFATQERILKDSGRWYADFMRARDLVPR